MQAFCSFVFNIKRQDDPIGPLDCGFLDSKYLNYLCNPHITAAPGPSEIRLNLA